MECELSPRRLLRFLPDDTGTVTCPCSVASSRGSSRDVEKSSRDDLALDPVKIFN